MPQSESTLKGGHPPAVKAGGMRISQHKPEKDSASLQGDAEDNISVSPPKNQVRQIINGVVVKGDADFPPEAVRAFHEEKPQPTHEFRNNNNNNNNSKHMNIHQPKK